MDRSGLPSDDLDRPDFLSDTVVFWHGSDPPKPCSSHDCLYEAEYLCDFPIGGGKTCDLPLCSDHRANIGPERDLCPIHAEMYRPAPPPGEGEREPPTTT
jgi:hypothetical protein